MGIYSYVSCKESGNLVLISEESRDFMLMRKEQQVSGVHP